MAKMRLLTAGTLVISLCALSATASVAQDQATVDKLRPPIKKTQTEDSKKVEAKSESIKAVPSTTATTADKKKNKTKKQAKIDRHNSRMARSILFLPQWAVGMPIAALRGTFSTAADGATEWSDRGKNHRALIVPSTLFFFPLAAASGAVKSPVIAGTNAWCRDPLSPGAIGLGKKLETKFTGPPGSDTYSKQDGDLSQFEVVDKTGTPDKSSTTDQTSKPDEITVPHTVDPASPAKLSQ